MPRKPAEELQGHGHLANVLNEYDQEGFSKECEKDDPRPRLHREKALEQDDELTSAFKAG